MTGGTGTGVGVAIGLNVANVTTRARIGDADVTAEGVTVEAKMRETGSGDDKDSTHRFGAQATSGAGGGKTGIAGSLAINVANVARRCDHRSRRDRRRRHGRSDAHR